MANAILITSYVAAVVSAATPAVFGRVAWYASAAIPVAVLVVLIQRRPETGWLPQRLPRGNLHQLASFG